MEDPLEKLLMYAEDSDDIQHGVLSTNLVRELVQEAQKKQSAMNGTGTPIYGGTHTDKCDHTYDMKTQEMKDVYEKAVSDTLKWANKENRKESKLLMEIACHREEIENLRRELMELVDRLSPICVDVPEKLVEGLPRPHSSQVLRAVYDATDEICSLFSIVRECKESLEV
jgi:predicted RNase H-like nuclease (RuvC/YqgF family)